MILAGLQFAAAYLVFDGGTLLQWLSPLIVVLAISLYGQLFNQLRDFDGDRKAGVTHTASLVGRRLAYALMMAWLILGLAFAAVFMFVVRLVPIWVMLLALVLAALLSWRRLLGVRTSRSALEPHRALQKPVEIAVAAALLAWFAGPWALSVLG